MTKIAFHLIGDENWHAGFVYLGNLLRALRQNAENEVTLSVMVWDEQSRIPEDLMHAAHEVVLYPKYRRWTVPWFVGRGTARILGRDLWSDHALKQLGVQIIAFGVAPQGTRIPVFAWLPDFQHKHLREMFSEAECLSRDLRFKRITEESTRIILLSETVRRDFQSSLPGYANKVRVVSPVSYIPITVYERKPQLVTDIYSLPEKFMYLPNQFWKHKNHSLAFRAVKILKDRGIEVFIACSGPVNDYRHPTYFSELLQQVSQWGIRNQIVFLGLIPREHMYMMMRQTICVISPSLFEGFGLTVDEARSLGKRLLLSDIQTHREQNPPRAVFFDPRDEEDLAMKMQLVWDEQSPGPDLELEAEAREILPVRLKAFSESFMSVVREVISLNRSLG